MHVHSGKARCQREREGKKMTEHRHDGSKAYGAPMRGIIECTRDDCCRAMTGRAYFAIINLTALTALVRGHNSGFSRLHFVYFAEMRRRIERSISDQTRASVRRIGPFDKGKQAASPPSCTVIRYYPVNNVIIIYYILTFRRAI